MSYTELFEDYFTNKLALGMLGDAPINTFLNEHPQIVSLNLCLDTDEPGRKAAGNIRNKYEDLATRSRTAPPKSATRTIKTLTNG